MKTRNFILFLLCILILACGEDRRPEYAERTALDRWVYAEMEENYYWYQDMPTQKSVNFFQKPRVFFNSLLSKSDGKNNLHYSYIDSLTTTRSMTEEGYGFEYETKFNPQKTSQLFARVLYTVEKSPAWDAGLKRGNWIVKVNGDTITSKNLELLNSGSGITVLLGNLDENENVEETEKLTIAAARKFEENPILYKGIYERIGKKIGYLVYNSFVSGKDENDYDDVTYLNELAAASNYFKSENVQEFILDLRYNPYDELNRSVPMMCSMLAPSRAMGQLMGWLEYNDKYTGPKTEFYFSTDSLRGGSNLNLSRVFVLVSNKTDSASEAVINFLTPYMDVKLIGTQTKGKNVGSVKITNPDYAWALHPIVYKIFNADDESDYESGLKPDYAYDENQYVYMLPLGNENEILLKTALSLIDGTYEPPTRTRSFNQLSGQTKSSLDRKNLPGAYIVKPE